MTDTAIIGAGPIGIAIAAACARTGVEHEIIDAGPIGATLMWWAPGTRFFSSPERIAIAGVPLVTPGQEKATREQYLAYLRQVVGACKLRVRTHTHVVNAVKRDDGFVLTTTKGDVHARRLVLAIGNLHRPRMLGVPGEESSDVSHYLRDPHEYVGRRVLIVGGKNSAVEAAIRLYRVGADVTMSYRGEAFSKRVKYWLLPELEWLIRTKRIGFLPRTLVEEIRPGPTAVLRTGERTLTHETDSILLLTGYEQNTTLFDQLGVELIGENHAPALNARTMETSIPGVYIAGTAAAGTERRGVTTFIETSHAHIDRVMCALTGAPPPRESTPDAFTVPET